MTEKSLRVLIVGSGGREHAILKACKASPLVESIAVAPGNGGMEQEAVCYPTSTSDIPALVALAKELNVNFVIVGPEAPLSQGIVDALDEAGIPAYGPKKSGAILEASKTFSKDFLVRHNIPTARAKKFCSSAEALKYLDTQSFPTVIKASGLAAGKGVIIAENLEAARAAVREMLDEKCFGNAGAEILIEDFMEGEEASIMLMVCGEKFVMLPASQDHKRIGDGDSGPNTGGMGAYAPAAVVTSEIEREVVERIVKPTLRGLKEEGIDYRGTLYVGIMITREGPKVVEFNVRFGDPECQVLLPLLKSDPVELMYSCATGTLDPNVVQFRGGFSVVVVLTAHGYPGKPRTGDTISFPKEIPEGTGIIHSGTKRDESGKITTAGGRVLGITAHGETVADAVKAAYALVSQVKFDGMHFRKDIASRQLRRDGLLS